MKHSLKYILLLVFATAIIYLGYGVERSNFICLISLIALCGIGYWSFIVKKWFSKRELIICGILIRASLLFYEPNLSDDHYRFIWDGQMIVKGENPYLIYPKHTIVKEEYRSSKYFNTLYNGLNSKEYYTVYPPVNQLFFAVSAYIGHEYLLGNVIVLKFILLIFEILTMLILFKLLRHLKLKENLAVIYILNPLVLIELVGNLHFEGVMLCFFLSSLYFLFTNRLVLSAVLMAFAVNTKLIPIMLLPLLIYYLGWKKSIVYYSVTGILVIGMFLPFLNYDLIENFGSSVDLYFQKFEFNASIYYVLRWIGIELSGFNLIQYIGYLLPLIIIGFIGYKSFIRKRKKENTLNTSSTALEFFNSMLQVLFLYYALATIVHPWYVINLVVLAVFVPKKHIHILVWSIVVYLSYFAYSEYIIKTYNWDKHQSSLYFFLVFMEYCIVFTVWFFQFRRKKLLSHTEPQIIS